MSVRKDSELILYEMMYILDLELGEDGIERMNDTIRERITAGGGTIEKDQPWGTRRFAYAIKKREEGYYHVLEFRAPSTVPSDLAALIRTQAGVLRYLLLKVPKAKIQQERRDAAAVARRERIAKREAERKEAKPPEVAEPAAGEPLAEEAAPTLTEETAAPPQEVPDESGGAEESSEESPAVEADPEQFAEAAEPEPTPEDPST